MDSIAENSYYGITFNLGDNDNTQFRNYAVKAGYLPSRPGLFMPHFGVSFGFSTLIIDNQKRSGLSTGLDLGVKMRQTNKFHVFIGTSHVYHNTKQTSLSSFTSQTVYFGLGYEF